MAQSALQIQLDYNNAIRQAEALKEAAGELRRTADGELQDCIAEISRNWSGENSAAYRNKCSALQEKIRKSAARLDKTADTIRQIAKNTYDAEMRAVRIATVRKY